ncbi:MAG: DUF1573 domain-containing protein [Phycisphaerales bacterium]
MKRLPLFLITVAILIGAVVVFAMIARPSFRGGSAAATEGIPLIEIVAATPADLGEIPVMAMASRTVTFRNTSNGIVRLDIARMTCGCLSGKFDKAAILPGETSQFEISMRVFDEVGKQAHLVAVRAAAGQLEQEIVLEFAFSVEVAYFVQPDRVVIHQRTGESGHASLVIRPHSVSALGVHAAVTDLGENMTLSSRPLRAGSGEGTAIDITTTFEHEGVYSGLIRVTTDSIQRPEFAIPVLVRVERSAGDVIRLVLQPDAEGDDGQLATVVHPLPQKSANAEPPRIVTTDLPEGVLASIETNEDGESVLRVSADFKQISTRAGSAELRIESPATPHQTQSIRVIWIGTL